MAANTWFEQLRFGVAKVLDAAGVELPWRGRLHFAAPFVVSDDTDYQASLVEVDAPALLRSGSDTLATVSVPADAGEGWVELWSVERATLAPADGTIRDLRFRLTVSSEDPAAADVATAVAVFQRADDAVYDVMVNADDDSVASDATGIAWAITLPVATTPLALRLRRDEGPPDVVVFEAQAHATIDRDVALRCYLGPTDVCPYAVTPT